MSPRKRRQFTLEQKASAVEIARTSAKPIAQIAREMDLSESALRNWVEQAQVQQNSPVPTPSPEHTELQRLRRELKWVEKERGFLKAGALSGEPRQRTTSKKPQPSLPKTARQSLRAIAPTEPLRERGTEGPLSYFLDVSSTLSIESC